ncbi:MAG: tautomerase family protein [Defluviitaleaceae bacterium]|nr:tautomerase family protein [Defluviitaleaceae bacterium]
MPLVRIEISKSHRKDYKMALLQAVHDGLVNGLSIPDNDRNQRLYELEDYYFERSPNSGKTEKFTLIEVTLLPGRSTEMKKNTITEITRLLGERLQITPPDVFIIIIEPPLENWSIGGKQGSEMGLQYKQE